MDASCFLAQSRVKNVYNYSTVLAIVRVYRRKGLPLLPRRRAAASVSRNPRKPAATRDLSPQVLTVKSVL